MISKDKKYALSNGWEYVLYDIIDNEVHGRFYNQNIKKWVLTVHCTNGKRHPSSYGLELVEITSYNHNNDTSQKQENIQVISRDKTYKLRNGWQYKLYNILSDNELNGDRYAVHGAFFNEEEKEWVPCKHTIDGLFFLNDDKSENDLIESTPFDHIKIDDKVLVWNNGIDNEKIKRHFAGVNDKGKPMCWSNGKTSFTASETMPWDNCELFIE